MARNYRLIPLQVVEVPEKYQTGPEWEKMRRAIRHTPCVCCQQKGKIAIISLGTMQWQTPDKLPEGFLAPPESEPREQEVMFGMCQPCFDAKGVQGAREILNKGKAVFNPKDLAKLEALLRDDVREKN